MIYKLVLVRHGESVWNQENRFTGWVDVDLTEKGVFEARNAGQLLKHSGFTFDISYTSVLRRAIRTLWCIQDEINLMWIPTIHSWRLNERHYGDLTGLNKAEVAEKYGDKQVMIWRRSYNTRPPAMHGEALEIFYRDLRYAKIKRDQFPVTECLEDTVIRILPLWNKSILPLLKRGKRILITAHGNSLRALIKYLDKIPDDEIFHINIPNGIPLVYELDNFLNPIRRYYLN